MESGEITLPRDLDILWPSMVQWPWTKIVRGTGRPAAMRKAGQKMQWKLSEMGTGGGYRTMSLPITWRSAGHAVSLTPNDALGFSVIVDVLGSGDSSCSIETSLSGAVVVDASPSGVVVVAASTGSLLDHGYPVTVK